MKGSAMILWFIIYESDQLGRILIFQFHYVDTWLIFVSPVTYYHKFIYNAEMAYIDKHLRKSCL